MIPRQQQADLRPPGPLQLSLGNSGRGDLQMGPGGHLVLLTVLQNSSDEKEAHRGEAPAQGVGGVCGME